MYDQLPPHFSLPRNLTIMHDWPYEDVKRKIADAGFSYPFIVKSDVGMKGIHSGKLIMKINWAKHHESNTGRVHCAGVNRTALQKLVVFITGFPEKRCGEWFY